MSVVQTTNRTVQTTTIGPGEQPDYYSGPSGIVLWVVILLIIFFFLLFLFLSERAQAEVGVPYRIVQVNMPINNGFTAISFVGLTGVTGVTGPMATVTLDANSNQIFSIQPGFNGTLVLPLAAEKLSNWSGRSFIIDNSENFNNVNVVTPPAHQVNLVPPIFQFIIPPFQSVKFYWTSVNTINWMRLS